jgi:hypothetical protein
MGLDMYVYSIKKESIANNETTDFCLVSEDGFATDKMFSDDSFAYWRKHPDLHGWMQKLYVKKGGRDSNFNGNTVVITKEDIDDLLEDLKYHSLPKTTGFFFGESGDMHDDYTYMFVERAKKFFDENSDYVLFLLLGEMENNNENR